MTLLTKLPVCIVLHIDQGCERFYDAELFVFGTGNTGRYLEDLITIWKQSL